MFLCGIEFNSNNFLEKIWRGNRNVSRPLCVTRENCKYKHVHVHDLS